MTPLRNQGFTQRALRTEGYSPGPRVWNGSFPSTRTPGGWDLLHSAEALRVSVGPWVQKS